MNFLDSLLTGIGLVYLSFAIAILALAIVLYATKQEQKSSKKQK